MLQDKGIDTAFTHSTQVVQETIPGIDKYDYRKWDSFCKPMKWSQAKETGYVMGENNPSWMKWEMRKQCKAMKWLAG